MCHAHPSLGKFAAILASMPDAITVQASCGELVYANDTAAKLLGYPSAAALLDTSPAEVMDRFVMLDADGNRFPSEKLPGRLALQGERAPKTTLRWRIASTGEDRWSTVSASPIFGDDGNVLGAINFFHDITEARLAEEALRESEERYRQLVQSAPDVIFSISAPAGLFTALSPAFERITGWAVDDWLGRPFTEIVHPDDLAEATDNFVRVLRGETLPPHELRVRAQSGAYLLGEFRTSARFEHGRVIGVFGIARDITERRRTDEAGARLSAIIESSSDAIIGKTLEGIITSWNHGAERLYGYTPAEAVGQSIAMLMPPGRPDELPAIMARLRRGERIEHYQAQRVRKDGAQVIVSLSISPLRDQAGKIIGAATIARDITEQQRAEEERARLLAQEQAARAAAQTAEQRAAFLAEASIALDASLNYHETLPRVARRAVPALADWCAIDVVDADGQLQPVAMAHADPAKEQTARTLHSRYLPDLSAEGAYGEVLRSGRTQLNGEISDDDLKRYARDAEHLQLMQTMGYRSSIIGTLRVRGRTLGVLTLAFDESDRRYRQADTSLVADLARRFALAIDNARLFQESQEARKRAAFLAEAGALLATSLDFETTLQSVTQLVVPHLADWCTVHVVEDDGLLRVLAAAHADPAKVTLATEAQQGWPSNPASPRGIPVVLRTGRPEIYPTVTEEILPAFASDAEHLRLLKELGLGSAMIVPLVARGRTLGIITFAATASGRQYRPDDLALAQDLAGRAALAVDNARLYREVQRAVQARDQFLSTAAHELKTPVATLKGYAQLLRTWTSSTRDEREVRAFDVINRQSDRLRRLVQDLLEVSRLELGRVDLALGPCDLAAVATEMVERLQGLTNRHRLLIRRDAEPVVLADRDRLEQVLANLLDNAIKFSPDGGDIETRVRIVESEAWVSVQDPGIGIAPDRQTHIFEQFYQAHAGTTYDFGGMGIGLYLSREIIVRHGGRIWVTSKEGDGTMMTFALPLAEGD